MEDLEGELERKIKMLEKERQAMRKETQGQHEKIDHGLDTVSHRVTELEQSEYLREKRENDGERSIDMEEVAKYVHCCTAKLTYMRALQEKAEMKL